ncbi:MAG: HU family DNA-binding protein [Bacillota bacterium]
MPKNTVEKALTAIFESIQETLKNGEKIQLTGFGTFKIKPRKAREGRNPQTGEVIQIPATTVPVFKPGKVLKDAVVNLSVSV